MSITSRWVAAALVAVGASSLEAQTPQRIGFTDALRLALSQNTTLKAARNSAALNAAAVEQQRMQFLPDLRASTQTGQSYGRSFSQSDGRIVDQTTQSMSAGLSSSLTLFDGLKNVAALRSAKLGADAGEHSLARAEQTVAFTVASNFLSLIQQREQLRVQRENLSAGHALEKQIQAFVTAGSRPISDLYQQQATVAAAQSAVVNAERAFELSKVDLMQTLQLDPRGTYDFVPPTVAAATPDAAAYNLDSLLSRAMDNRKDIDAKEDEVSAADQDTRAARAGHWPTLSLNAGYNTAFSSAANTSFIDQIDQRRGGSVSIGMSIPLFDRRTTDLATQRAQLAADNARLDLKNQQQQVGLEVRRAYLDYHAATQQLRAAEAQQRAAELALTTSQQRYNVGAATLLEVTQARAAQLEAASNVVRGRYGLLFQRAVIEYCVGDLNPQALSSG
jgi:outer membrane protein